MSTTASTTTKHTSTPWRVGDGLIIKQDNRPIDNSGVLVASAHGYSSSGFFPNDGEAKANAAFIVRACNSHEQLLEYFKASVAFSNIAGHEEATVEDERKAEERFDRAQAEAHRAVAALTAAGAA